MTDETKVLEYLNELTIEHKKHFEKHYPNLKVPSFSIMEGSKYHRVVIDQCNSRAVHCFLDNDGNIYKAAGWKTPAKGIRGSIFDEKRPIFGHQFYR